MGIFSSCLKVKADGAKVDVITNVKDLVTVNVNENVPSNGSTHVKSDTDTYISAYVPTEDANYIGEIEVIKIVKILFDVQPIIYIDEKNRVFVKAVSSNTRYRDTNGENFILVN